MDGELFADTQRLRAHADLVAREGRAAQRLCNALHEAQRLSDPPDPRYMRAAQEADKLWRYFVRMEAALRGLSDDFEHTSHEINSILQDSIYYHRMAMDKIGGYL